MVHRIWLLLRVLPVILAVFWAGTLTAQDSEQPEEPVEATEVDPDVFQAPVIVDGDELFLLRGSSALPAEERVATVETLIIEAAEKSKEDTVAITFKEIDIGTQILADGIAITVVTEADAELEQFEIEVLARLQGNAIRDAILSYRAGRSEEARVESALAAIGWTVGFALFCTILFWLRRRLRGRIRTLVQHYFASLESATNAQVQADAIAALIQFGVNIILFTLLFLGIYYYLSFVLLAFTETRYIANLLLTYVTEPVLNIVLGFLRYVPNLITLAIIALMTRYIIKGLRAFFDAVEAGSFDLGDFEKHWINPTFNITRVVVILIALVFSFPYIPGSDSAAFQGLTILIGAMLSLGSNSVVGNMLSGLFVIYRRSTSIGDRIKIGEHVGDVVEIKLMETHLKSIKNELISIPNAELLNSEVVNYSKQIDNRGVLLHSTVGIGYEEPPEKIDAMLIEAARRTDGLKQRPGPFVLWSQLADYAINYQINAYMKLDAVFPQVRSDLHRNVVAVFRENQVQIMTPSYMADPETPKVPPAEWDGTLARQEKS